MQPMDLRRAATPRRESDLRTGARSGVRGEAQNDAWGSALPATCPVQIKMLGGFEIRLQGKLLEFGRKPPKKPLALLKLLVAQRGSVRVGDAIDALWPDEDANALSAALHRLRRLLAGDVTVAVAADATAGTPAKVVRSSDSMHLATIELQDGLLKLDRSQIWVDVLALTGILDKADDPLVPRDRVAGLRKQAMQMYAGHFLPNHDETWAQSARARLQTRFNRASAAWGHELEATLNYAQAAAHYERAIGINAECEPAYQGLMRCHLARGWRSEGLAAFELLRHALHQEAGLPPSQASIQLHQLLQSI